MAVQSPTVRRRRLGQELRQLRESRGLTCEQVGEQLEWSGAKVSRIETARVGVRQRDVRDLLDLYQVADEKHRSNLLLLTREANQRGWWESYADTVVPGSLTWIGLEAEALGMQAYDVQVINGLLQTEEYARAVLKAVTRQASPEEIDQRVAFRMKRQEMLTRQEPLHLWAILDEAVLRRQVGGPHVMRGQLTRLLEVAEAPQVTLQILPFSAGAHVGVDGAFRILEMPAPDQEIVCIEDAFGTSYRDKDDEVREYTRIFDRLRATAMSPDDSVRLISDLVGETTRNGGS